MKISNYGLILILCALLYNCTTNREIDLTFQVNITGIGDIKDPNTLGIIGSPPLLNMENRKLLKKKGNNYQVTLQIPDSLKGKVLSYTFIVDEGYRENEPFPLRSLILPAESSILPIVKFNDLIGSTGNLILPKPPNVVKQANTPEEAEALAEPFVGITTDGTVQKSLFSIKSTGIPTDSIRESAEKLRASLSEQQKSRLQFQVTDNEWRKWHNTEFYKRQGIGLFEMNELQKNLTFDLIGASLSPKGVKKTQDIMAMESYLADISVRFGFISKDQGMFLGPEKYYITFLGLPSKTEPWGWQFEGHHLVINYFILGDQVVMTPTLMGSEPTYIEDGPNAGLRTFEAEEQKGMALYKSLSKLQKNKATLWPEKKYDFAQAQAFRDNTVIPYVGIQATELNNMQIGLLLDLIFEYVGNMRSEHAPIKMEEVTAHLNETWFSWVGDTNEKDPFYYRIHSPVILIEFDHQKPVFLFDRGNELRPGSTRKHIHTVIRTPNGNDYGKDLLQQHLKEHHH